MGRPLWPPCVACGFASPIVLANASHRIGPFWVFLMFRRRSRRTNPVPNYSRADEGHFGDPSEFPDDGRRSIADCFLLDDTTPFAHRRSGHGFEYATGARHLDRTGPEHRCPAADLATAGIENNVGVRGCEPLIRPEDRASFLRNDCNGRHAEQRGWHSSQPGIWISRTASR